MAEHFDLGLSSYYGLEGNTITWHDIPVFPHLAPDFGNSSLPRHAAKFFGSDPGFVVTLCDLWPLDVAAMAPLPMACWTPVDHEPAPPMVENFLIQTESVPIAMSRFGERMLGLLDPFYVPHAVDTSVFRPQDTSKVKRASFGEGAFVCGMVAANKGHPSRKGFAQALQAFARFARAHDDAFLYLHTVLAQGYAMGEDISAIINAVGIPRDRLRIADQYAMMLAPYATPVMAEIYASLDVLLSPSFGEGFGVPVLEAAACGVPSIITDFTAMPEVAGLAAWKVGFQPYWSGQDSWQATPNVGEIYAALEEAYAEPAEDRKLRSRRARDHALQYDVRRVMDDYWLPVLRHVEQRLTAGEPIEIPARQMVAA